MACGVGAVAEEIAMYGYKNVDGLDPIKGYLEAAQSKGVFLLIKKIHPHLKVECSKCECKPYW